MNVEIMDCNDTELHLFHESQHRGPSYSTSLTAEPQRDIVSKDVRPEPARQTAASELDASHPASTTVDHEHSPNTIQRAGGETPLLSGREEPTSEQVYLSNLTNRTRPYLCY